MSVKNYHVLIMLIIDDIIKLNVKFFNCSKMSVWDFIPDTRYNSYTLWRLGIGPFYDYRLFSHPKSLWNISLHLQVLRLLQEKTSDNTADGHWTLLHLPTQPGQVNTNKQTTIVNIDRSCHCTMDPCNLSLLK